MKVSVRDVNSSESPLVAACVCFTHNKKQLLVFMHYEVVMAVVLKAGKQQTVYAPAYKGLTDYFKKWVDQKVLKQFPEATVKTVSYSKLQKMLFKGV